MIGQMSRDLHATSIMAEESALTPHQPIYVLRLLDTYYVDQALSSTFSSSSTDSLITCVKIEILLCRVLPEIELWRSPNRS